MFNRCLLFMQFFGFLAVPPLCGVTWLGTASSDLAPSAVEHVDVIECLPKNCAIATICDYLGVSHFKLQHASHPDALSFDQPIIDNSRSVTSAADGINVQRVDRLFSGLGCSGTGTMFNRCLLFMQPRRAQLYRALEFLVVIILSSTILMISSCKVECMNESEPKAICVQGGPGEGCNCTCEASS
nr:uncharacterized protein LOC129385734 isoform X2 [Dermacentor andersoni]